MADQTRGGRALKRETLRILQGEDLDDVLRQLTVHVPRRVINPLFSFLLHEDEKVRWRAIMGMGAVASKLAADDRESARVIIRRLMWSLNDESGGIGWGAPEAMGEILARHEGLAGEFASILVSYMNPDGNFLEHPVLQRGLMWAVARLVCARPEMMAAAVPFLSQYLESSDATTRGLAAWSSGLLGADAMKARLEQLAGDGAGLRLYVADAFRSFTVGELASQALSLLGRGGGHPRVSPTAFCKDVPGELCLDAKS